MADTSVTHAHDTHEHEGDEQLWEGGGKSPKSRASYGKVMMWYFLVSDAFTFAGFLIAYGALDSVCLPGRNRTLSLHHFRL